MKRSKPVSKGRCHEGASSAMLTGRVREYYYDHLAGRGYAFDTIARKTKAFFHTVENQQMCMLEWRNTTIESVIRENTDQCWYGKVC
ncbi:hypothetical protein GGR52DRAFT_537958 [Hypoxylon sp. FL1284]|nr:hypothetical protein GGR52DRAFT_537958 [Hypoxylon sp. FL1284]